MSEHYDFHYQPTGSGAISGQQVLEQTEDAINELGDYVNDNVGGAMDVAQQALETAQNAEQDAQTALDTANSFSSAIQSAQQDASTALSTAQTAQTTASNANNTAIQAQQDASSAVTTANNASGQVNTLSGTVTALGQRVTTAEGNIGQNTSDITALTTRVGTAEGNITTLQNDVSIAQGNASSAMATAGQVKQQAFVFRYSSTALVASSTNSNALLDNTDNLKVGDKVIDSSGVLFSITAIDTQNSTFTIGTALVDLAQDSDVVHKSGDETVGGEKTFSTIRLTGYPGIKMYLSDDEWNVQPATVQQSGIRFTDKNSVILSYFVFQHRASSTEPFRTCWRQQKMDGTNGYHSVDFNNLGDFYPENSNTINLGGSSNRWKSVYATEYYYGSNNVEFSTKFVTTDTAQTVGGIKTFSNDIRINKTSPFCNVFSSGYIKGQAPTSNIYSGVRFFDDINSGSTNNITGGFEVEYNRDGYNKSYISSRNYAGENHKFFTIGLRVPNDDIRSIDFLPSVDNIVNLGTASKKWKSFNGLNPSSLSMPDLSNGIDISSYVDITQTSQYTAPADGYISICGYASATNTVLLKDHDYDFGIIARAMLMGQNTFTTYLIIPVVKNHVYDIICNAVTTLDYAKFFPCQGNV